MLKIIKQILFCCGFGNVDRKNILLKSKCVREMFLWAEDLGLSWAWECIYYNFSKLI